MKKLLAWWYAVSLPRRPLAANPMDRERERYGRLTAGFLLLLIFLFVPVAPIMLFFSPASPSSPPIALACLALLAIAWFVGRMGRQIFSACCIIALVFLIVTGPLVTNPFDIALIPLFSDFTIAVLLAGALLPPFAALITGLISCIDILLVVYITTRFDASLMQQGGPIHFDPVNLLSITVGLPITIQIVVSVLDYVIMRNLLNAIHRADRAEEIVALQAEVANYERERRREQERLTEGLEQIAEAHARIANGDYRVRIALSEGHVLWSIAVPLNNLLNRLQAWKVDADQLQVTRKAAAYVAAQLRAFALTGQRQSLPMTGTPVDQIIVEMNKVITTGKLSRSSGPLPRA